jgi:hypothetical protein
MMGLVWLFLKVVYKSELMGRRDQLYNTLFTEDNDLDR